MPVRTVVFTSLKRGNTKNNRITTRPYTQESYIFFSFRAGCSVLKGKPESYVSIFEAQFRFIIKCTESHKMEEGADSNLTCFTDSHLLSRKHH